MIWGDLLDFGCREEDLPLQSGPKSELDLPTKEGPDGEEVQAGGRLLAGCAGPRSNCGGIIVMVGFGWHHWLVAKSLILQTQPALNRAGSSVRFCRFCLSSGGHKPANRWKAI